MNSHENLSTLGSREAIKRALPKWEYVPEKHDSSSHANPYCKGVLTGKYHHDGVDAGELQNMNKVGQPMIVEANKETSYSREHFASPRVLYQAELEREEKGQMHGDKH